MFVFQVRLGPLGDDGLNWFHRGRHRLPPASTHSHDSGHQMGICSNLSQGKLLDYFLLTLFIKALNARPSQIVTQIENVDRQCSRQVGHWGRTLHLWFSSNVCFTSKNVHWFLKKALNSRPLIPGLPQW